MKKFALSLFFYVLLFQSVTFAAPTYQWSIPDNVRVVQLTAADNVRIFSTIAGAINSIPSNTSDQYQIQVMPGTYSTSFILPSHISLVGSGKESTIINVPIVINGNTAVDGIKFLSNTTTSPLVTVNDGFTVELRNIAITVGPDSSANALFTGSDSKVTLVDSDIYVIQNKTVDPGSNIDNIIKVGTHGTLEIGNSKVYITFYCNGSGYALHSVDGANVLIDKTKFRSVNEFGASELIDGRPLNLVINNSVIELEAENGIYGIDNPVNLKILGSKISANSKNIGYGITAVNTWNSKVLIDNSVIVATLNNNTSPDAVSINVEEGGNAEINNSNLSGPVSVIWSPQLKIGNSKIGGGIKYNGNNETGTFQFFGCYDDNFQACAYPPIQ